MSLTVLACSHRRAAHGLHRCALCGRKITVRELYEDQRCADDGTAWTVRSHLACVSAFHSWDPDYDDYGLLSEYSNGHLPPCLLAWFQGDPPRTPSPPCACEMIGGDA